MARKTVRAIAKTTRTPAVTTAFATVFPVRANARTARSGLRDGQAYSARGAIHAERAAHVSPDGLDGASTEARVVGYLAVQLAAGE